MRWCFTCQSPESERPLAPQLCGLNFCVVCHPAALAKGAWHWSQVYRRLYPWR